MAYRDRRQSDPGARARAALGFDYCRRHSGGGIRAAGGLVYPRLRRRRPPSRSRAHDDGERSAAAARGARAGQVERRSRHAGRLAAARRAPASDGRGAEVAIAGGGRRTRRDSGRRDPVKETPAPAFALPMLATLSAAPAPLPSPHRLSPIQRRTSDRTQRRSHRPSCRDAEAAEIEPGSRSPACSGARAKPHGPVAALRTAVPLPRPKPTELTPEPDLPAVDRHSVN